MGRLPASLVAVACFATAVGMVGAWYLVWLAWPSADAAYRMLAACGASLLMMIPLWALILKDPGEEMGDVCPRCGAEDLLQLGVGFCTACGWQAPRVRADGGRVNQTITRY